MRHFDRDQILLAAVLGLVLALLVVLRWRS